MSYAAIEQKRLVESWKNKNNVEYDEIYFNGIFPRRTTYSQSSIATTTTTITIITSQPHDLFWFSLFDMFISFISIFEFLRKPKEEEEEEEREKITYNK